MTAKHKLPAPRVGKVIVNARAQAILDVTSAPALPPNMSTPIMVFPAAPEPAKLDGGNQPAADPAQRDVLSSWAWSTNSLTALPDDESEPHPQLSRKPLFYALGGAFALMAVVTIVAYASEPVPIAAPRSEAKPPAPAKVEPASPRRR